MPRISLLIYIFVIVFNFSFSEANTDIFNKKSFFNSQTEVISTEELKKNFQKSKKINIWNYIWKVLIIFFLIIFLLVIALKYKNKNILTKGGIIKNNKFNILYQQYLSSTKKIILIKSFDKYLLLGVTDQSINKITEFKKHEIDTDVLIEKNSNSFFETIIKNYK
ncbi:MAG: flagellar biosynthetic protein FliO [Candidatus Neomarinimicrobiota bacterium]|jgi:flagellar biogenesis protein FliO|nr:flagellar biosynthetic protein FliO [Candidatus Neomarinimicrobiota bacterium]|tara:strand:+ start:3014 stop:3508 length:495 start_codon:yes stop_codon:yes gene_type:complete